MDKAIDKDSKQKAGTMSRQAPCFTAFILLIIILHIYIHGLFSFLWSSSSFSLAGPMATEPENIEGLPDMEGERTGETLPPPPPPPPPPLHAAGPHPND